jgi:hypothetical protein
VRTLAIALVALGACAPKPLVIAWAATRPTVTERIEIRQDGEVHYRTIRSGEPPTDDRVDLTSEQVRELGDMFRAKRACELPHDLAYTPAAGEATITLELGFPELRCTLTLWEPEWRNGAAQELAASMSSIHPAPPPKPTRRR